MAIKHAQEDKIIQKRTKLQPENFKELAEQVKPVEVIKEIKVATISSKNTPKPIRKEKVTEKVQDTLTATTPEPLKKDATFSNKVILPKPPMAAKKEILISLNIGAESRVNTPFIPEAVVPISLENITRIKGIALEPTDIFEAYEPEFDEVEVPKDLIDEINAISTSEIISEFASEEEQLEPQPEVIFDVLAEEDIQKPAGELTPNHVITSEVHVLSETTIELMDFAALLNLPELPENNNPETVEILNDIEIAPLPQVCIEVTTKINELQVLEPESAQAAVEMLQNITFAIDEVIELRMSGSELAPETEAKLQELCIELFTALGINHTPETVMEFVQGIMQAKQMAQAIADKTAPSTEKGTHEIKHEHDPVFDLAFHQLEDYMARALGIRAVRNTQFALAA